MSTIERNDPVVTVPREGTTSWWVHGLATLVVVAVVALLGWYLLADPTTSLLDVYPLPFNAALFWALMFVVWTGFNLELFGFARLPQPLRGIVYAVATVVFAVVVTWVLAAGLGSVAPDFAASQDGGTGYFTGALFVLTGLTLGNWPWRLAGSRARVAGASLVGNIVLGTALYSGMLAVCTLLIGADTVALLGDAVHQFPAQLGVCWVAWMILWANAFGNRPTGLGDAANLAARTVITFGLAVGTFCLYYYVLAGGLLHEPVVAGLLHGNALGFMDWFALVTLLYVVGFESYGLPRPRPEATIIEGAS